MKAPSLVHFVRSLVGMDRAAAQVAFSKLLSNQSLAPPRIRFVEMIIEQLTARGVIEPGVACSPKTDPVVMRVFTPGSGEEIFLCREHLSVSVIRRSR